MIQIVSRFKHPVIGFISVIGAAVISIWIWLKIMTITSNWATFHFPYGYHLIVEHLAGSTFLLIGAAAYHRWIAPIGLGRIRQRSSILPAIAVFAVYMIEYGYGKLTGLPPERWVVDLLNQPILPLLSIFITIFVLAPLGEEILFRGILLNIFRTNYIFIYWVGVVITSLIFSYVHQQYQHLSTLIEIMFLSIIFAWARLRSGGLALPVLLHAFASTIAVILS